MSFETAKNVDFSAARAVRLGGCDWLIAPLSLRQILAIADYVPKLSAIGVDTLSGERLAPLAEVLWHGLRRAHPQLTREEFFDLPITIAELVAALPVVIEQAGGKRVDAAPGEIGTPSRRRGGDGGAGGGERFDNFDWRGLVAELVIELHWTRDQVLDQIDMLFLEDLQRAWADAPPLRKMVAAYLGYKPRVRASRDYGALLAMFPAGKIK